MGSRVNDRDPSRLRGRLDEPWCKCGGPRGPNSFFELISDTRIIWGKRGDVGSVSVHTCVIHPSCLRTETGWRSEPFHPDPLMGREDIFLDKVLTHTVPPTPFSNSGRSWTILRVRRGRGDRRVVRERREKEK